MKFILKLTKILALFLISIIFIGAILIIFYLFPLAKGDLISINPPEGYIIQQENYYETQGYNECAAFATAYLLRHFGYNVYGKDVYQDMKFKLPFLGVVPAKGIIETLNRYGLNAKYYKGNINTIKAHVSKDRSVILYVGKGLQWEHYITMIGFDNNTKEIYIFDSLQESDINGGDFGNKTISEEELLKIWDNGLPFLSHTYIVAEE